MNLNFPNRRMRTRMSGGVAGDRRGNPPAPMPIALSLGVRNIIRGRLATPKARRAPCEGARRVRRLSGAERAQQLQPAKRVKHIGI